MDNNTITFCDKIAFDQEFPYLLDELNLFLSDLNFYLYPIYLQKLQRIN
jgi:hypothetical protein